MVFKMPVENKEWKERFINVKKNLKIMLSFPKKENSVSLQVFEILSYRPATVAQHVAHPLVVGKVIGSNLGPTLCHN